CFHTQIFKVLQPLMEPTMRNMHHAPHRVEGFRQILHRYPWSEITEPALKPWVRNSCRARAEHSRSCVFPVSSSRGSVEDWRGRRFKKESRLHAPPYSFISGARQTRAGPTAAVLAAHRARYEGDQRFFVLPDLLSEEARRVAAVCQNRRTTDNSNTSAVEVGSARRQISEAMATPSSGTPQSGRKRPAAAVAAAHATSSATPGRGGGGSTSTRAAALMASPRGSSLLTPEPAQKRRGASRGGGDGAGVVA
ncbi:unnamed protein product, partial [Ectocarpus sp. 6 AP-2014]